MGADGGMSGSVSRGGHASSSDVLHPLPLCLPLEPITLGTQKYVFSGELRKALGISLGSASEPFRTPSYKPSTPAATEELKHFKENVLDALIKAKERSRLLGESLYKLDKYIETMGSRKRQRSEFSSNEKPGGSSMLKIVGQPSRNLLDRSAQRVEDKAGSANLNKRFRSSAMDIRVDGRSGSLSKDHINNEKETNITKPITGVSVQPDERIRRLSAVGEGWDRKMKRKRSVGMVANRYTDSEVKGSMLTKLSSESKSAASDVSISRSNNQGMSTTTSGTVIKGKISRAPRNGSVNSFSDNQAPSETCEGWEQPSSTNKVISLGLMQNHHRVVNSSPTLGGWGGQRQQKSSRSRRTIVVSPVSNQDEGQISSVSFAPPDTGARVSLNGTSGCLDTVDVHNNTTKSRLKVESSPSPGQLLEVDETRSLEHKVEEKGTGCSDAVLNGKGKVRPFQFPTKRNKNAMHDSAVDGVRRQGRTMRGLSSSKVGVSQCEVKLENVSMVKPVQNMRLGSDKIRSKSGRPPSKKMLAGRILTRAPESDDDHEELLAAAAAARKAGDLSCSGRFWKKMEPIFGPVSSQDAGYVKQQMSFAEELEGSLSQMVGAGYNILGFFMQKERANVSSGNLESHSRQLVDKGEEFVGEGRSDKFSSLYQRVLSALIEEDEYEGACNGNEGVSLSFQCASDDSHCGSCNYADAETRDRDRFESEAESIVDFQIQKRCVGDRFSCNKSVTSNTTRNASMSDSLHSSGRWLGDDGLSHSDVEFVSGNFQNDQGVQLADVMPGTSPNCQYHLMCVDDRLILELQSIGLYLDTMPDLTEGEELIDQDIMELKEGLCEQVGKKKHDLVKIDKAMQNVKDREKQYIEQVAMEQLIQMAYKRRMACRRNNTTKTVMRKVSKQVAMGFIERTLARCKTFEVTGRSCFSEPTLQNIMFAPPQRNDADSISHSMLGSCIDDSRRAPMEARQTASHSSEYDFSKLEPALPKGKKRELLLDDVGGAFPRGTTGLGTSLVRGAKGKRSERERDRRATPMTNSTGENQSVERFRCEQNQNSKPQQNSVGCRKMGLPSSVNVPVDDSEEVEEPIDFSSLPMPDFDSIEQLGISNDPNVTQDIGFWFDGLQEDGSDGLHIPMDDLSMINL